MKSGSLYRFFHARIDLPHLDAYHSYVYRILLLPLVSCFCYTFRDSLIKSPKDSIESVILFDVIFSKTKCAYFFQTHCVSKTFATFKTTFELIKLTRHTRSTQSHADFACSTRSKLVQSRSGWSQQML